MCFGVCCGFSMNAVNLQFSSTSIIPYSLANSIGIAIAGTLVPGIMIPVLSLSKDFNYDSSVAVSPNGPIGEDKSNNTSTPEKFCLGCGRKLNPNVIFCENCGKKVE